MSRTLTGGVVLCGESFAVRVSLPDEYFDHNGIPLWHKINNRFGAQADWCFDRIIGGVPRDGEVSSNPRSQTDSFNYYRELFTRLFEKRPERAEQIQNAAISLQQKITQLEKELR